VPSLVLTQATCVPSGVSLGVTASASSVVNRQARPPATGASPALSAAVVGDRDMSGGDPF